MKGVWKDGFKKNLNDNILYISKEAYYFSKRKPKVVKEDEIYKVFESSYKVENEKFYEISISTKNGVLLNRLIVSNVSAYFKQERVWGYDSKSNEIYIVDDLDTDFKSKDPYLHYLREQFKKDKKINYYDLFRYYESIQNKKRLEYDPKLVYEIKYFIDGPAHEKFYIRDKKYYYKNRLIPDYLLSSVSSRRVRKKSWKKLYSGRERTAVRNALSSKAEESPEIKHNKSSVLWDIF